MKGRIAAAAQDRLRRRLPGERGSGKALDFLVDHAEIASECESLKADGELVPRPDYALIDGVNEVPKIALPSEAIVGGDAASVSIAAASIIARVTHDQLMDRLHARYPQYGFDHNRGYRSADHLEALDRCGLTPAHRLNKGTKKWLHVTPCFGP